MTPTAFPRLLRDAVLDASAILLPVRCAGCGVPDRDVCPACKRAIVPAVREHRVAGVRLWSSLEYEGVARSLLLAFKDAGRVDAARSLAAALRPALAAARTASPSPPLPVLVPSTRVAWRRRGYHPTGMLLARSRLLAPPLLCALRPRRQTADQAGLSGSARAANRRGSLAGSSRLRGRRCLVIDDIVTSGATISEATRAILAAGGDVVGAVAVARTPLRDGFPAAASGSSANVQGNDRRWSVLFGSESWEGALR